MQVALLAWRLIEVAAVQLHACVVRVASQSSHGGLHVLQSSIYDRFLGSPLDFVR